MKKTLLSIITVIYVIYTGNAQNKSYNLNDLTVRNYKEIPMSNVKNTPFFQNAERLRELFINPIVQNIQLMRVNDTILLDLFSNRKYKSFIDKIDIDVNGTLTVRARLTDYKYGHCVISTFNGKSLMTIEVPENNELYMSRYDNQTNKYYILQIDKSKQELLEGSPPLIPPTEDQQRNNPKKKNQHDSLNSKINNDTLHKGNILNDDYNPNIVTLMIVYTPAAAVWASANETNINNTISLLMAKSQLVLDNSNTLLTVQLVHSEQVSYTELNNPNDLNNLTNTADGFMDNVHSLRDTYYADLVVLLEEIGFTGGLGYKLLSTSGSPSYAFSLTRVQQASWSYTTIHEIGHNMGLHHHKSQNSQPGPGIYSYSAGWRWTGSDGGQYCSVMTYEDGSYFADGITHSRVAYFSNPSIQYQGAATGDATDADNARTIRQTKSVVAAYRVKQDPNDPGSFAGLPVSQSQINLGWIKNVANNPVMVAYSSSPFLGTPMTGTVYNEGNIIPGGGTVIYKGALTYYNHTSLTAGTTYYYKAWSVLSGNAYSTGIITDATTLCGIISIFPWNEGFDNAGRIPACWMQADNQGNGQIWQFGAIIGLPKPSNYAYLNSEGYGDGNSQNADLICPTLNLSMFSNVTLQFNHYFRSYEGSSGTLAYSINDGSSWTNISTFTTTSVTNPQVFRQVIDAIAGQSNVKFKWNYTGTWGYYWAIDDVMVFELLAHDVSTISVDLTSTYLQGTVTPQATVKNIGTNTETFPVTMSIGTYTSTKIVTTLGSNVTQQVTFDPWTATAGAFNVQVCTQLVGDLNTENDCKSVGVKVLNLNKQVYAYNLYKGSGTDPVGPTTFNMSAPGTLNSIANQSAMQSVSCGTWAKGAWYGIVYNTKEFITINPTTGARTVLGTPAVRLYGLSYNTANNIMYGVDGSNLYSVNITTGATTLIGNYEGGFLISLAINASGQAYALDIVNDVLGTMNLSTGAFTSVGSIGFDADHWQSIEFDRETGELYMAAFSGPSNTGWLAWVNQTTGATVKIGDFEGGAELTALAIPYSNLNVSVFLEGAFNSNTALMNTALNTNALIPLTQPYNIAPWYYAGNEAVSGIPDGVVDWVLVELRDATNPLGAVPGTKLAGWPKALFLKSNGSIVALDGTSLPNIGSPIINNNLYVIIRHRNHLPVISAFGASLSEGVFSYDFTTGLSQAYGGANGYKLAGSKAVMVAGDVDLDGNIFVSDYNKWATDFGKTSGYFTADLDMDKNVFVSDYNKWATNFGSKAGIGNDGTFDYNGRTYGYKTIGTQTWMTENLAYLPSVSPPASGSETTAYYYVYGYTGTNVTAAKATTNYSTNGVLYNWEAAKTACPAGWHLPSDSEWLVLVDYLGGLATAGGQLKETGTTHWFSPNTGATNTSGFTALGGGYRNSGGAFTSINVSGYFQTSSIYDSFSSLARSLYYASTIVTGNYGNRSSGFSVRCLRD